MNDYRKKLEGSVHAKLKEEYEIVILGKKIVNKKPKQKPAEKSESFTKKYN